MQFDYENIETASMEKLEIIYKELWDFRKTTPAPFKKWETSRHHFLPKSMGGTDYVDNYIRITNEEHFIAHYILHRIYGGRMTSAFNRVCGGIFKREEVKSYNLEEMKKLFISQEKDIRRKQSKNMSGPNNPSFGLCGKLHPTNKTSKAGSNNPNYGKKATDLAKKRTSEANSNMVIALDLRNNNYIKVSKEEFDKCDYYVGTTNGKSQDKIKGTVSCLNLKTSTYSRVSKEEFDKCDYLVGHCSKKAKEFRDKKEKNEL